MGTHQHLKHAQMSRYQYKMSKSRLFFFFFRFLWTDKSFYFCSPEHISLLTALQAPLALKDPVFCKFSALKYSCLPARAFRFWEVRTGVLCTSPWILLYASRTSRRPKGADMVHFYQFTVIGYVALNILTSRTNNIIREGRGVSLNSISVKVENVISGNVLF